MSYEPSSPDDGPRVAFKILIAGGFGTGKTTLVGSVSEIRPLRTEEYITEVSAGIDDIRGIEGKQTTTLAMDFGRITLSDGIGLYLFGTPGQERFWFMWQELSRGALGAVVLVDTRRITASFGAIDYFEQRNAPFLVAVNCFDNSHSYTEQEVRTALDVAPEVPVLLCDARRRSSAKEVLITLVEHAIRRYQSEENALAEPR